MYGITKLMLLLCWSVAGMETQSCWVITSFWTLPYKTFIPTYSTFSFEVYCDCVKTRPSYIIDKSLQHSNLQSCENRSWLEIEVRSTVKSFLNEREESMQIRLNESLLLNLPTYPHKSPIIESNLLSSCSCHLKLCFNKVPSGL